MNVRRLYKIADKVVDYMTAKSFLDEDMGKTDPSKVIDNLYRGVRLPKKDKELLDLIIKLRIDGTINHMRAVVTDVVQRELKSVKEDIDHIKKVVGCNGG